MKRRLFSPCVVAIPCRTMSAAAGLRLAWQKNPSVSFYSDIPDSRHNGLILDLCLIY